MKHPYNDTCDCKRCVRERERRTAQSAHADVVQRFARIRRTRAPRHESRRPIVGSQEWAETRGDDLGESYDY